MSLDIGFVPTAFINTITKNYFNFNGRTSRMGFWHFFLGYLIIAIIMSILAGMLGKTGMMISNLVSLALFLPTISIGARRLHDIGKSGWWQLVPLYNLYLFAQPGDTAANTYGAVPPARAV